jgi:hypothetical protein
MNMNGILFYYTEMVILLFTHAAYSQTLESLALSSRKRFYLAMIFQYAVEMD